jgi:excisionase family DNA binding protein
MLTPRQAADRLGVSLSLIYQLCKEQVLRHFRLGGRGKRGRIRIEEGELERYRTSCLRQEVLVPQVTLRHLKLE